MAKEPPHLDAEFKAVVAEWRSRHRLAEDDAVLLLVELFRLHQRHWDELRRRELPSFEHFRADIAKLSEGAKSFQQQSASLLKEIRMRPGRGLMPRVSLLVATISVIFALMAGFLIGKAFP